MEKCEGFFLLSEKSLFVQQLIDVWWGRRDVFLNFAAVFYRKKNSVVIIYAWKIKDYFYVTSTKT